MKQQGYEAMARENEGLRKAWAEATEAGGRARSEVERLKAEVEAVLLDRNELLAHYQRVTAEKMRLKAENERLREVLAATPQPCQHDGDDVELLDWLEATQAFEVWEEVHDKRVICIEDGRSGLHSACTLRDAIRAAIRRQS